MKAEAFYEKHGSKTMLLAHFVPLVRTFVPVTAGAARMNRKQYVIFDAIGCSAWAVSTTLLGYYLGTRIPGIEKYFEPVLLGIIIISLAPTLFHILRDPKIRASVRAKFKKDKPTE
jgi:membrane-associated protein